MMAADHGLVLTSRLGTPIEPDNLGRSWFTIRSAPGLDWLRIHDLRHACAMFLPGSFPPQGPHLGP